uniref:HNH nuclease domain-containing protein n=1 Tax=viral metagenome TaxID=1070528 RepID=A0A6C0CRV8_9ZZZZ
MTRLNEYEDYYGHDGYYDYDSDHTYSNDENDEDFIYDAEFNIDSYEDPDDIIYKDETQSRFEWRSITIGDTTLQISNTGAIQYPNSIFNITYGNPVPGTPYRCIAVKFNQNDYRNYYIHDLVWMAFYGDIPNGWEVGHKELIYDDTQFNNYYKNDLEYLDIYTNIVSRDFNM